MRVAILGPSGVPFAVGGAENAWISMQAYINSETKHQCELFKLPSPEGNLRELVTSYCTWSEFEVMGFDVVISTKYPSWMVSHPHHVIHMYHKLRGLYDTYQGPKEISHKWGKDSRLLRLNRLLDSGDYSDGYKWQVIESLREVLVDDVLYEETCTFPGPLAKKIVHYLDSSGLDHAKIKEYYTVSKWVAQRANHFPMSAKVGVLPLVPRLNGYYCGDQDFFLVASRLDAPKRIDLAIKAMKFVAADVKLVIAGTGPQEEWLKLLAGGDPRIEFVGHVTDSELLDFYGNCLACIFIPYDEDFGLVTIEAMRSSKPVITASDSGGPLDFVVDGETGRIVSPNAKSIAQAINDLAKDSKTAKKMGRNAAKAVEHVRWDNVVPYLIGEKELQKKNFYNHAATNKMRVERRTIVVASTFPFHPAVGGGQVRAYNIFLQLSAKFNVIVVCLVGPEEQYEDAEISPGYRQIKVPKSMEHQQIEDSFSRVVDYIPCPDIVAIKGIKKESAYYQELEKHCNTADIVVAEHPYLAPLLAKFAPKVPLWLEAQNFELKLKQDILGVRPQSEQLLKLVEELESFAWGHASLVTACSQRDLDQLRNQYGESNGRELVVENGFSPQTTKYYDYELKQRIKHAMGMGERPTALFIGSWHGPNIDCVRALCDVASVLYTVDFFVIGSVCDYFGNDYGPNNLKLLGVVSDQEKELIQACSDVALNPMELGSGSNLKLFDYMASGTPVMTSSYGSRGFSGKNGEHYILVERDELSKEIIRFFVGATNEQKSRLSEDAAEYVRKNYSWPSIVQRSLVSIVGDMVTDAEVIHGGLR